MAVTEQPNSLHRRVDWPGGGEGVRGGGSGAFRFPGGLATGLVQGAHPRTLGTATYFVDSPLGKLNVSKSTPGDGVLLATGTFGHNKIKKKKKRGRLTF